MRPAEPSREPSGSAFMLYLLLYNIVLTFAVQLLYIRLMHTPYAVFFETPWFAVGSQVISFLLPLTVWLWFLRGRLQLNTMRLGRVNVVLVLAICLCLQPLMMLLSASSTYFFPNQVADVIAGWGQYPFVVKLFTIAVTPALCEEVVFRGYILSRLESFGIPKAAFVSGLFFGMMHLDAQQFLYAFVMGVVFAYFVYYTRSIRAGMLAHFFVNALQLGISAALSAMSPENTTAAAPADIAVYRSELLPAIVYLAVVSLIFLPAVVILFRSFLTHNRQRNVKKDMSGALREITEGESGETPGGVAHYNADNEPESNAEPLPEAATQRDDTPQTGQTETPRQRLFGPLFWGVVIVYVTYMAMFWFV